MVEADSANEACSRAMRDFERRRKALQREIALQEENAAYEKALSEGKQKIQEKADGDQSASK